MSERRWTPQQQNCIDARGGTVLVSAAAGSGKTAVLIERIITLISDNEDKLDIDRLLVVTFTKAAAAEMRSRLGARLSDLLSHDPHNQHLLRQQMLLPQATICTIDSFCAQLLREHATSAGVSPRFRVAEDTALRILKNDTAEQVIRNAYEKGDPAFRALCDLINGDRGDKEMTEQLLRTYDFIQAHPFPLRWLEEQAAKFREDIPVTETVWAQVLLERTTAELQTAKTVIEKAIAEIAGDDRVQDAYGDSLAVTLRGINEALACNEWDAMIAAIQAISFPRVKQLRGYEDADFKAYIVSMRDYVKKLIDEHIKTTMNHSEARVKEDIATAAPLVGTLSNLVAEFTEAFTAAKAEQNMLDFNDIEHVALSMLAVPDDKGGFVRTDIAREIGQRFKYIMVDEYQDTNATQDTLFSAISDNETNLFFVGDIKQSIYGFRQAMPSIFRERRERGVPYNGKDFPASITLGNNFRSRRQVTDTVNYFFRQWMQEATGGIVYDEREELVASAKFENADDPAYDTELIITEKSDIENDVSVHEAEARLIGKRILTLMSEGFRVSDKNGLRQATYRDFCILLRSTSNTASVYVKAFQNMGIPISAGNHESFFECAEIRVMLCILRAIDNPLLDIPMLGTLTSPLFGFTPDDTALIRGVGKDLSFFAAVRRIARTPKHSLHARCREFLQTLERYRTLSAVLPADQLIRRLYDETNIAAVMSAKSSGAGRLANLRQLYDLARKFEQNDARGLAAFVRYIDKLESRGIDISSADPEGDNRNAVRLMTIHRSKGLEFPVVFVAGLGSTFNNMSTKEDILLHADRGIGIMLRDREAMTQTDPIHRRAISAAITHSEKTEELRVLYVAMTRAKDKLILLATVDNLASASARLQIAAGDNDNISPTCILRSSRRSDWVLAATLRHPAGQAIFESIANERGCNCRAENLYVHVTCEEDLRQETVDTVVVDEGITLEGAAERLAFTYPYRALGNIPAKITASQTAHRDGADTAIHLARPAFLSQTGLSPAQRGTATHLFLEFAQLASGMSAVDQAARMVERDQLTEMQKDALNLPRLQKFLESSLAQRMAASPLLLREFAFAIERTIGELSYDTNALPDDAIGETVMVQGIADAVFEENGELIIVDYKTDRVDNGDILRERYLPQLAVYKEALSRALDRPVGKCVIYSFHLNDTVDVL